MLKNLSLLCFLILAASAAAFGQYVDVSYDLTVECSEMVVVPGGTTHFTAKFAGAGKIKIEAYNWTVSAGEIVSGQGTPSIEVAVPRAEIGSLTATVDLMPKEAVFPGQKLNESCTVSLMQMPKPELVDSSGPKYNCERDLYQFDSLNTRLNNDPNYQAYIVVYSDTVAGVKRRRETVTRYINSRKIDNTRLTFLEGAADEAKTEIWLVPPGADPPSVLSTAFKPARAVKPTGPELFGLDASDGITECNNTPYDPAAYADALAADKTLRGKVVIGESSVARFRRKVAEIRRILAKRRITPSRVVFKFEKVGPYPLARGIQLWTVPK
jgi:hypothetical protein